MKKTFSYSGCNGDFEGFVGVNLKYRKEKKTVNNPSTHDDYEKTIYYHNVTATINTGLLVYISPDFTNENDAINFMNAAEAALMNALNRLAHEIKNKTFKEILKDRGYG